MLSWLAIVQVQTQRIIHIELYRTKGLLIVDVPAWMKSGRKSTKAEPKVHKDPAFDELDDDAIDYIKDAQDVGRTRYVVHEEKESAENKVSTEDALNTAQPKVSTKKEEVSTDRPDEVPPPMTGIYIPSGPDKEIDDSQFTYGPKQSKPSESDARSSDFNTCESNYSKDEHVSLPTKEQETPSFAFINTVKHVKTPRQTVKEQNTCSQSPKPDKKDCSGLMAEKLEAKQAELNNRMSKGSGQRKIRPVWNNVQRVNHQNQFVPKAVLTRTGKIQVNTTRTSGTNTVNTARTSGTNTVNTARHNFNRQAVPTNAARKVNTVKPIVNNARPKAGFHKTLSPFRKPFNRTTTLRTNFSYQKVNTAEVNAVSAVGGKRETAVKPSAGCNWRHKRHYWNKVSKYNGGSSSRNCDYPQRALQNKGIVDSGCSRHMTGNKAYLAEYQDFNGGPVAFGGSKGYITGKVKSSKANNAGEEPNKNPDLKTYEKPVDKEDQVFLDELERLKRQEQDANDTTEALKKEFAKDIEDLLLQAGAAKASSTNTVNTASTPVSTASPYGGLSFTDTDQDDSEIPALEDMYDHPTDGIFTNASYDNEGAVADFTNLETIVNVSPIPTSRINSIHHSTLIFGDQNSAVQTRSKVTKSSRAYSFEELLQFKIKKLDSVDLSYRKAYWNKMGFPKLRRMKRCCVLWEARLLSGLQVKQEEDGIFKSQKSSVAEIPEEIQALLLKCLDCIEADIIAVCARSGHRLGANLDMENPHMRCNILQETIFHGNAKGGRQLLATLQQRQNISIRSELLFDDVMGLNHLPNQAIFDAIQLMGREGSGGNHGGQSSSDRSLSGNEGGMTLQSVYDLCISLCTQVTDQAKEIKHLKAQIKKLKKKAKPQIHEDDLDEMDLKWQLALLSMKARKFYQIIGKKIIINGSDTAGYDKKKVECFNCHKLGHFARECRNPRSQENRRRSQDSSRRTVNVNESSSKAMYKITKLALKICLKNFEDLKSSYDKLRIELSKSESDLYSYKKGLASVEEQLIFYNKNESMLCDQIVVLKSDASFNELDINALKKQSGSIDCNQISDKNKMGLGYNDVPPPLTGLFAPPSIDLSNSRLEKFVHPEFEGYGVKVNKDVSENVSKEVKKNSDAPVIEDWVSDCDEDETVVLKSLNVQKPKQADQPRKVSQNPRNNSTSWNTPMPKKLRVGFQFTPKAYFVCGGFNHLIKDCDFHDKRMVQKPVLNNVKKGIGQREVRPVWTNAMRVYHQNFSNSRRNFAPTAVLTKSGLVPFSTARENFSRKAALVSAARPFNTAVHKPFVNVVKTKTNVFQKVFNSPCFTANSWLVQDQTVLALATPGQTATGKESSNPFMAGSLPKTINANNVDKESQAPVMISDAEEYLILEDPVKQGRMKRNVKSKKDSEVLQEYQEQMEIQAFHARYSSIVKKTGIRTRYGTSYRFTVSRKKFPLKKAILERCDQDMKIEAEERMNFCKLKGIEANVLKDPLKSKSFNSRNL
ncbi:ribonuclease H-like domain-containing protein [Tanacetum coccineum]|uniref:Ribonuclease H-like domain-containing protein n=1 Tax=Tanacetum coccineum TaxID=301880 RepID=A0ABQ5EQ97_9ASTR